jgi:hypothetical protein
MSFKRLDPQDFVVSADSITSTLWSGDEPTLTTFFTSSDQENGSSGDYYLSIYQTASDDSTAAVQFNIAYGNKFGSGSIPFNSGTGLEDKAPTSTVYGQYRTMVLGDENTDFVFGDYTSTDFIALPIERARYKEGLFPGSLNLILSGSGGEIQITDNSKDVASITFVDSGRKFELVSGSDGSSYSGTGYTPNSGSYGWMLPDIGVLLLNPSAVSHSIGLDFTSSWANTSNGEVNTNTFDSIVLGESFKMNSQETITSDFVFVRARNAEFNYSENPSYISGSTGEVIYDEFINSPQSYITTVGMYNDNNDLLAVAKLSKPLLKDFTKETLVRVKLDF